MKKATVTVIISSVLALSAPLATFAMNHDTMPMGHGDHSMMGKGNVAYQEVVDGVKATFAVTNMWEQMKGMEMPRGMKETHHIAVEFKDAMTGKPLTEGTVKVKVIGPDKTEQIKDLMGMHGHFGADVDMAKKGKYGVLCKFQLKDGTVRSAKFWYSVK